MVRNEVVRIDLEDWNSGLRNPPGQTAQNVDGLAAARSAAAGLIQPRG
jgi:hypothetical protein